MEKHLLMTEFFHLDNTLPCSANKMGLEIPMPMVSSSGQSAVKVTSFLNVQASPQRKILNQK